MTGPYFEDLVPGWSHRSDGMTVTDGHSAWYLALSGDTNPVHLDARIAQRAGFTSAPISTALLAQIAIGQSTAATREVVANLYYRDVVFPRPVFAGTTVETTTRVLARSETSRAADPRGKVLLGMQTVDQDGALLASIVRCALVRKRDTVDVAGQADLDPVDAGSASIGDAAAAWEPLIATDEPAPAGWRDLVDQDTLLEPVTDALQLVRATGNLARAHRDEAFGQGGRRLVYGGHSLALAQASVSRALPVRHVIVGWELCTHPAPVFEGDVLRTATAEPSPVPGKAELTRFTVGTVKAGDGENTLVQRWMPLVLSAR